MFGGEGGDLAGVGEDTIGGIWPEPADSIF